MSAPTAPSAAELNADRVAAALASLHRLAPNARPQVAVLLGSGWSALVDRVDDARRIAYAEIAGFAPAGIAGHRGELVLGHIGGCAVAVLAGRVHAYENGRADNMALPLQVLHALGCGVLVQTNAAGSLDAALPPGALMLLADHLNLAQRSPLVGLGLADPFVAMADAYDPALRALAREVAAAQGVALTEGVYAWCQGPQFETPAEVRMLALLGARAVGMSTVPETILARALGMRVLALSLVTNLAAGLSSERLSHAHTLAQARAAGAAPVALLQALLARLAGVD